MRALKKDGILVAQLPNPMIWTHLCGGLGLGDKTHANNFGLEQWKTVLTKQGLKIEKCFGQIAFAYKKMRFFAKSKKATRIFPEWLIISKKHER